jgi:hypothetical protein
MKDNARHDQGSARSLRTPLSRSATPARRFETSGESTYKTQTKCRQNRKCDIFSYSAPTTYNFSSVKCLNFPHRSGDLSDEVQFSRVQAVFFRSAFLRPFLICNARPRISKSPHPRVAAKRPMWQLSFTYCTRVFLVAANRQNRRTRRFRPRRIKYLRKPKSTCADFLSSRNFGGAGALDARPSTLDAYAFVVNPKMRKNETFPETQKTDPLRPSHLRRVPCVPSHFQGRALDPRRSTRPVAPRLSTVPNWCRFVVMKGLW